MKTEIIGSRSRWLAREGAAWSEATVHVRTYPMRGIERRIGRASATVGTRCGAPPTAHDVAYRDVRDLRGASKVREVGEFLADRGRALCARCVETLPPARATPEPTHG